MKIKILLFPLIILIVFYLSVAHIFPDWQRIKELNTEIEGNELVMENIKKQQRNVDSLATQISAESARKDELGEIVPGARTEEVIIDSAHQLAEKYGVVLLQMGFIDKKDQKKRTNANSLDSAPVYAQPESVEISVLFAAPYNNSKEFIDNFARIMRAHTPANLTMTRSEVSSEGEEVSGLEDQLETIVAFNYPFMEAIVLQESDMKTLQHPIQAVEQFDMTPLDEWTAMTKDNVSELRLGDHGRGSSPFMP